MRRAVREAGRPFLFGALVASAIVLAVALATVLLQPAPWRWWEEGPPLPRLSGYVVDGADILPRDAEDKLTGKLRSLETRTGYRMVVLTVASLQEQSIEGFSLRLGRKWAADGANVDDGLILIVAPDEYRVRIEGGSALGERLGGSERDGIIRDAVLPPFAKGDFAKGIDAGTAAIIRRIG